MLEAILNNKKNFYYLNFCILKQNLKKKNNKDEVQEEIGDIIFTLINLARFLGISADDALRKSNNKFISRFKMVENELKIKGKNIEESSINEMDEIWDEIKTNNN